MIKSNELRIGNLVNYENEAYCVWSEIRKYSVTLDNLKTRHIGAAAYDEIDPIQLTEEWLLKFGFEEKNKWFKKDDVMLGYISTDENLQLEWKTCVGDWVLINVTHVHQLQNLYFALTKQDLEIKN
jgi:hypothetical protein